MLQTFLVQWPKLKLLLWWHLGGTNKTEFDTDSKTFTGTDKFDD